MLKRGYQGKHTWLYQTCAGQSGKAFPNKRHLRRTGSETGRKCLQELVIEYTLAHLSEDNSRVGLWERSLEAVWAVGGPEYFRHLAGKAGTVAH